MEKNNFWYKFFRFYIYFIVILVVFVFGLLVGRQNKAINNALGSEGYGFLDNSQSGISADSNGSVYNEKVKPEFLSKDVDFNLFWDVWSIIKEQYLRQPVNETQLLYGAMMGSVASLGDPHSVFFDPETTKEFTQELNGSFEGIGAEIAIKHNHLTIVAPLPDSPAEKAGIRAGDKIYAINDEDTTGISLDYAVSRLRGPKGTEVVVMVSRESEEDLIEITIVRDTIELDSVKLSYLEDNIALIKLRYFNDDTTDDFNQNVLDVISKNPKAVILDLRNNPGGYLDTAIDVASSWVDNDVVVYEKYNEQNYKEHKSSGLARLKDFPTYVLINEGSASASEIVAGALQDYKIATIVGETSFGKGTVQSLFPLEDGSTIKLTVAEWVTPNKNAIDQVGIEPDYTVELTAEDFSNDFDPQMDKVLELINTK